MTHRYIEWDYEALCDVAITPKGDLLEVEYGAKGKTITLSEAELDAVVDAAMSYVPPANPAFRELYDWFDYVGVGG